MTGCYLQHNISTEFNIALGSYRMWLIWWVDKWQCYPFQDFHISDTVKKMIYLTVINVKYITTNFKPDIYAMVMNAIFITANIRFTYHCGPTVMGMYVCKCTQTLNMLGPGCGQWNGWAKSHVHVYMVIPFSYWEVNCMGYLPSFIILVQCTWRGFSAAILG